MAHFFDGYPDYSSGDYVPPPRTGASAPGDGGSGTGDFPPPDLDCRDKSQMTPQELKDYQISQEAARVATIIMGKPDRDKIEYGAYIIRSNGGSFTHLEVTAGGATWVNPTTVGMANWGQVVGYVHSHPAEQFVEQFPELKLFPTADNANRGQGDWFAFDDRVQRVGDSLAADYGMSPSQVSLELAQFRQYILGPSGKAGENLYQLHGFDTNDRDGTTLGQRVNLNLATCP